MARLGALGQDLLPGSPLDGGLGQRLALGDQPLLVLELLGVELVAAAARLFQVMQS